MFKTICASAAGLAAVAVVALFASDFDPRWTIGITALFAIWIVSGYCAVYRLREYFKNQIEAVDHKQTTRIDSMEHTNYQNFAHIRRNQDDTERQLNMIQQR